MIVEKYCKDCGGKIIGLMLPIYPPIYREKCERCGRIVSERQEKIVKKIV